MEKLITTIPKNSAEEIHVSLSKYEGHDLADVRIYFKTDSGEWCPTRKGISLRVEFLPHLLKAIGDTIKEARKTGVLKE